jgi:hypothetical protein
MPWLLSDHWGSGASVTFKNPTAEPEIVRPADVSLVSGSFDVLCRVCDLNSYELEDLDIREGHLRVVVEFGPNIVDGHLDLGESAIQSYGIFAVEGGIPSETGTLPRLLLADALAVVNKSSASSDGESNDCGCNPTQYSAEVSTVFPANVSELRIMVVPIIDNGEVLPIGVATDPIMDTIATTTATSTSTKSTMTGTATSMPTGPKVCPKYMRPKTIQTGCIFISWSLWTSLTST